MLVNAANITEKKYQKLTIQVSLNGMSFFTSDTLNHKVLMLESIEFDTANTNFKIEDTITELLTDNPVFKERYDEIGGSKCIRIGGIEERGYKKKPYFYIPHKKLDEVCEQGSWVHPVVQAKNEEKKKKYQANKLQDGVCFLTKIKA
jgi:hypothetical protein